MASRSPSPKRLLIADGENRFENESDDGKSDTSQALTVLGKRPPFTRAHQIRREPSKFHLLIGVTGSVAAIKLAELVHKIRENVGPGRLFIKIVVTKSAAKMLETIEDEMANVEEIVYDDRDEWSMWRGRGDPVLHIELRKWADAFLIAPLDANTLAKIANGLCDNLLTCIVRAWDSKKTLFYAPAMNTAMWESVLTTQQRKVLTDFLQYREIPTVTKELMCGEVGDGGMASTQMIASIISQYIKNIFAIKTPVSDNPICITLH